MKEKMGKLVKEFRLSKELTQGEMAAKLGIGQGNLSKIEQGHVEVNLPTFGRLLRLVPPALKNQLIALAQTAPGQPVKKSKSAPKKKAAKKTAPKKKAAPAKKAAASKKKIKVKKVTSEPDTSVDSAPSSSSSLNGTEETQSASA